MSVPNPEPLPDDRRIPHPRRLSPKTPEYDEILAVHEDAIARGEDSYVDPLSGLWTMTAVFLWERGYCCYSGCRHCPWIDR